MLQLKVNYHVGRRLKLFGKSWGIQMISDILFVGIIESTYFREVYKFFHIHKEVILDLKCDHIENVTEVRILLTP